MNDPAATPARPPALIDPTSGEVLDLDALEPGELARLHIELERRETQFKEWRTLVADELRNRLGDRRRVTVGSYEIDVAKPSRGRVWDADELELACRELVDAGTFRAGELAGVIGPPERKVDGNRARDLLGRVTGQALERLEACFRWETKGRPRLTVTESISLEGAAAQRALASSETAQEGTQ